MTDSVSGSSATTALLPAGSQVASNIDTPGDADWWRITLTAGTTYLFDLVGSSVDGFFEAGLTLDDPFLALRGASGATLLSDDDSGVGLNARILFTPTQTGIYYLDAQGYDGATGSYALIANANPVTGTLDGHPVTSGVVDWPGDTVLTSVTLAAGSGYVFNVDGSTLVDPFLELLDASGNVVDYDDDSGPGLDSQLAFVPDTAGLYYVAVRSVGHNATGQYTLRVVSLPGLSIAGATAIEGNSGQASLVFQLTLSTPSATTVSVNVETMAETAQPGTDYVTTAATVTFLPGQTVATFTVPVKGDTLLEANEYFFVVLADPVGAALAGTGAARGLVTNDDTSGITLPADEGLLLQWHLYGDAGVNAVAAWSSYTGQGVRVGVFDQGVAPDHPDLAPNLLEALGRRALDLAPGGAPVLASDDHGTAVAGVIAAAANGTGEVGVAPGADIISIYSDLGGTAGLPGEIANAFTYARSAVDVLNDSWGYGNQFFEGTNYAFFDDFSTPAFAAVGQALQSLATLGRNGLGTVVVQSAGNAYGYGDDTNLHNLQNSRYIITVGGTTAAQHSAGFSSQGASILVSAPSGDGSGGYSDILTTDRLADAGFDPSDSAFVAGTSFSAPIVSGVVALMLEANPALGYRDVQEILTYSARRIDTDGNDWAYNGADNWNGGGLHYDSLVHDLGFGLVDARAAVRLAETWGTKSHTAANLVVTTGSASPHLVIPDSASANGAAGARSSVQITSPSGQISMVERAEVTLDVTHPRIGDLYVVLTSPSGVKSFLVARPGSGALSAIGSNQANIHFTFDTVLDWGEHAFGSWQLAVFDDEAGSVGTFDSWSLKLYGAPVEPEMTYYYTDEFASVVADDPARGTLTDTGGDDTLNAAAVSTDSIINLAISSFTSGFSSPSRIAGQTLNFGLRTAIRDAYGGDGNDRITGNELANTLYGMRGNDSISAGEGNDTVTGGRGNDVIDGGTGVDTALFSGTRASHALSRSGSTLAVADTVTDRDGTDTVQAVEVLRFEDRSVDLGAGARSLTLSAADLKTLEELYVGFFNRIPEASGLGYWIDQHAAGVSLAAIANQFYDAGVQFGNYPATMTNTQFIQAIYANVLYRPPASATAPTPTEIGYWNDRLISGADTKGTMVLTMLHDVHAFFETDPVYGFVAQSLNNKALVANYYAVQQGLSLNVQIDNVAFGIQMASLITPTDTSAAIALVGANAFSTLA